MIQDPYLHGSVEVLTARPQPPAAAVLETWCCQGCGHDRPLLAAWRAKVRNRSGPARLRALRLCATCVADLLEAGVLQLLGTGTTGAVAEPEIDLTRTPPDLDLEPEAPPPPAAGQTAGTTPPTPMRSGP